MRNDLLPVSKRVSLLLPPSDFDLVRKRIDIFKGIQDLLTQAENELIDKMKPNSSSDLAKRKEDRRIADSRARVFLRVLMSTLDLTVTAQSLLDHVVTIAGEECCLFEGLSALDVGLIISKYLVRHEEIMKATGLSLSRNWFYLNGERAESYVFLFETGYAETHFVPADFVGEDSYVVRRFNNLVFEGEIDSCPGDSVALCWTYPEAALDSFGQKLGVLDGAVVYPLSRLARLGPGLDGIEESVYCMKKGNGFVPVKIDSRFYFLTRSRKD